MGGAKEILTDEVTGYLINMQDENNTLSKTISVLNNFEQQRVKGTKLQERIKNEFNLELYRRDFESELLKAVRANKGIG